MREIEASDIKSTISRLFQEARLCLPEDVLSALKKAWQEEESPIARDVLDRILENSDISATDGIPLCQDTGSSAVFLELG